MVAGVEAERQAGQLAQLGLIGFGFAVGLLQKALAAAEIGELLVDLGMVDERDVLGALSDQFGIGLAQLKGQTLDSQVAGLLPETMVRSLRALPILTVRCPT